MNDHKTFEAPAPLDLGKFKFPSAQEIRSLSTRKEQRIAALQLMTADFIRKELIDIIRIGQEKCDGFDDGVKRHRTTFPFPDFIKSKSEQTWFVNVLHSTLWSLGYKITGDDKVLIDWSAKHE